MANFGGAVLNGDQFTMDGGTVQNNKAVRSGGAVYNFQSVFTVSGGKLNNNQAGAGGAVFVDDSEFTMDGGEMKGNKATQGGAVQIATGNFTLKNGEVSGNQANFGGAVFNFDEFRMEGGTIQNNKAVKSGGALYDCEGTSTVTGGKLNNNQAGAGGAVFADNATLVMDGGEMKGNVASQAGAVQIAGGEFTLKNGEISGNQANFGGGLCVDSGIIATAGGQQITNGTFTMKNGRLGGNMAIYGGALFNVDQSTLEGGVIAGNSANNAGGAVYVSGGECTMNGGEITGNVSVQGGAVQIDEGTAFAMNGGKITGNMAAFGGAVLDFGTFSMDGGEITGNDGIFGGGVYVVDAGAEAVLGGVAKIADNTANGEKNNVYLTSGLVTLDTKTAPASGMSVGISMDEPGQFSTNGTTGDTKYFFSDDPAYYVHYNEGGYLELKAPEKGRYAINVIPGENGTVVALKQEAAEGETVTLSVTPNEDYRLKRSTLKVTYTDGNGQLQESTLTRVVTGYIFKMPGNNVTVTAEFEKIPEPGKEAKEIIVIGEGKGEQPEFNPETGAPVLSTGIAAVLIGATLAFATKKRG